MKTLLLKTNSYLAVLFITILVVVFYTLSYSFFTVKFEDIEDEQNKKNINSFLTIIDNELSRVESITVDYAYWDATYRFINDKNSSSPLLYLSFLSFCKSSLVRGLEA